MDDIQSGRPSLGQYGSRWPPAEKNVRGPYAVFPDDRVGRGTELSLTCLLI